MAVANASEHPAAPNEAAEARRWRRTHELVEREQTKALVGTLLVLVVGFLVLWVAKQILDIQGDALFVTLLLAPFVVYLALSGKISALTFPGGSVAFKQLKEHVEEIGDQVGDKVTDIGRLEQDRIAYRGKLEQIAHDSKADFCLLYADIDHLRKQTQADYKREREQFESNQLPIRQTEEGIRAGFIKELELAFTDAFYEKEAPGGKCDVFRLQEPDLVLIARGVGVDVAKTIARRGAELFAERKGGLTVTVAVLARQAISGDAPPEEIDRAAGAGLEKAKQKHRGEVVEV